MFSTVRPLFWIGLATWLGLSAASADQDALRAFIVRKAGVLELLHSKAERALVTAGQDQTLRGYFEAKSDGERARLRERIDRISLAVQERFAVEEMSLINEDGAEISRIVSDEIAYDLATDEADAIFFAPAFAQEPRTVYVSPIYLSPDAEHWVTAHATPIVAGGEKKAILHYEHGLDFYEKTLNAGVDPLGERVLLTARQDGWIISDSRKPIPIEQFSLGGMKLQEVTDALGGGPETGVGSLTVDGARFDVAFKRSRTGF